jgi:hypothetical protein
MLALAAHRLTWSLHKDDMQIHELFKNGGQEGKTGPAWGMVPVGEGGYKERVKKSILEMLWAYI